MKGIVIWAHSKCRSTFGLYRAIRDVAGVPVRLVSREGIRNYRVDQGQCEDDFSDMECPVIGEDWDAAEKVLDETIGWLHLVAAYQVSPTFRKVILCAKKRGDVVGVISEAPWNAQHGFGRLLWPLYLRTILRHRVREVVSTANFLVNYSGDKDETALTLGWNRGKIIPFGYFPLPLAVREGASSTDGHKGFRMLATATKGRLGRGEDIVRTAVKSLGEEVELVLPGFVGEDEVVKLYEQCDVFIAAGCDEPWGIRVNDALNFGKPVLVSDGMGARKLVEETGAGLVFKSGSAADLAAKLRELMRNYERFAVRAREAAGNISPTAKAGELLVEIERRSAK